MARTDAGVHDTIRASLERSPLFNGTIQGVGPRYCPSIEDKVVRFPEKTWHQVIIEPEGLDTNELYLNGLSTSLPEEDQLRFLRRLRGFENVEIMRPGYAVEYDFVPPTQLTHSLALRGWQGLYLAGQINGTSGYEEAAAQGLMAGLNAARWLRGQDEVILGRDQAYIGVLIDDLVSKGTAEPYRLFTSLAEFRLLLRQDNADLRLMDLGHGLGLLTDTDYVAFQGRRSALAREMDRLEKTWLRPTEALNQALIALKSQTVADTTSLSTFLRRPEIGWKNLSFLSSVAGSTADFTPPEEAVWEEAEIQIKYEGYIKRQWSQVEQFKRLEDKLLPPGISYQEVHGLSREARQKLAFHQPRTAGQASRLSGVSPADVGVLLVYLESQRKSLA
jgi:tRNA uridine 5-carboxymethylaminomethyl modification enzyme